MESVTLTVRGNTVTGELALEVAPGTLAGERDRALDQALAGPLSEAAETLGSVLAAAPHRYARPTPGKDATGLTHFVVRARVEGETLVPDLQRQAEVDARKAAKKKK
jgi:hypothetical protein